MKIPIDQILPNPEQPRTDFDPASLRELADSILQYGVLQPIVVEEAGPDQYILVDGERRLRACKLNGFTEIDAALRPSSNGNGARDRLVMALIANLQRVDLNHIEEARAYRALQDQGLSIRQISIHVGKSEARISTILRLLDLDEPIQKLIIDGKFTTQPPALQAILSIPDPTARVALAEKLAARGLGKNSQAIERSAGQLVKRLQGQLPYPEDQCPALEIAQQKAPLDLPKWDIIAQAGKVPPWSAIYKAAVDTCNACPLRPAASASACKDCPAVRLLLSIIELGTQESARLLAQRVVQRKSRGR